jgi:hypothetical protein
MHHPLGRGHKKAGPQRYNRGAMFFAREPRAISSMAIVHDSTRSHSNAI